MLKLNKVRLLKVALTGGLASGKSSVCRMFSEYGAYIVSADQIVHELLVPHTIVGNRITALFGDEVLSGDHLDRAKIAKIVFQDQEKLTALESILHPEVLREIDARYLKIKDQNYPVFIAEIPLLFETSFEKAFDYTICIWCPEEVCVKRYISEGHTEEEYFLRTRNQMDPQEKKRRADFVIDNSHEESLVKPQVIHLLNLFHKESSKT